MRWTTACPVASTRVADLIRVALRACDWTDPHTRGDGRLSGALDEGCFGCSDWEDRSADTVLGEPEPEAFFMCTTDDAMHEIYTFGSKAGADASVEARRGIVCSFFAGMSIVRGDTWTIDAVDGIQIDTGSPADATRDTDTSISC